MENIEKMWLRHVQEKNFPAVFSALLNKTGNSLQRKRRLYIDDNRF